MAEGTDLILDDIDAPTYVDFTDMDNLMEDDEADKWFDHHFEDDNILAPMETNPLATPAHLLEEANTKQEDHSATSGTEKENSEDDDIRRETVTKSEKTVAHLKKYFEALKHPPTKVEKKSPRVAAQKANANIKCILSKRQSPAKRMERKPSGEGREAKTTEELQMEEIKRLQMETRKRLRQNRRSFRKLATSSGPIAVKGSKPTTRTKEFKFHSKMKEHHVSDKSSAVNVTNFPSTLRSSNNADTYNPNFPTKPATPEGVTKVKPFHFHLDERLKSKKAAHEPQADMPTAEAILKYEKSTPPRFRRNPTPSKKNTSIGHNTSTGSCKSLKLTMPKTPKLMARERSRPVAAKSAAEKEEEAVKEMKEYQFKANPLNPKVFNKQGLYGVPRKREGFHPTEAHTPELATKKRCLSRRNEEEKTETEGPFHANPMPNFDKITGVPEKKVLPITEPDSPAITAKRHCPDNDSSTEEEGAGDHCMPKPKPAPDFSKAFKVDLPHRILHLKPFSFEERDKDKPSRETLVQMILKHEKKPEFKAQPLPDFNATSLPPKTHLLPTKLEPFSLRTEVRGQQHSTKLHEKVEQETVAAKMDAEFRAQGTSVLYKKPFMPKKPNRPLTSIDNFHLHTELRSEKRAKFDADRFRKEREIEVENLKRRALRDAEEAKEISKLRKTLVHKAQPIHHYEPVVVHTSDIPITVPVSPRFLTDERLRQ